MVEIRDRRKRPPWLATEHPWHVLKRPYLIRLDPLCQPDGDILDRLLRYETHADRALHKALETLAKLRGATVETIMARVTGTAPDGSSFEFARHRSDWRAAE